MNIPNSARLSFQQVTPDDAEWLYSIDQDVDVMRYVNGGVKTTKTYLNDVLLPRLKSYTHLNKGWGLWKVTCLTSDKISTHQDAIGWVLVRPMSFFTKSPEFNNIELGWRFKKSAWGKGYATEAAKSVADAIRLDSSVTSLCAIADENNIASINIMTKLGMKFVKNAIYDDPLGGTEVVFYRVEV